MKSNTKKSEEKYINLNIDNSSGSMIPLSPLTLSNASQYDLSLNQIFRSQTTISNLTVDFSNIESFDSYMVIFIKTLKRVFCT